MQYYYNQEKIFVLLSKLWCYLRIEVETGKKAHYSQTYAEFEFGSADTLHELLGLNSSTALLYDTSGNLAIYPATEEAEKEVEKYKDTFLHIEYFDGFSLIVATKVSSNLSLAEDVWSLSWYGSPQEILVFAQSVPQRNQRRKELTVAGQSFRKVEGGVAAFIGVDVERLNTSIHILDPLTGRTRLVKELSGKAPEKLPLLAAYDNAVVIGLIEDKVEESELILMELCISPKLADNSEVDVVKLEIEELVYPIITSIKINKEMLGAKMVRVDDKDLVITATNETIIIVDIDKIERAKPNDVTNQNAKIIRPPDNVKLLNQVTIEYNEETRSVMVVGPDVFAFQLT